VSEGVVEKGGAVELTAAVVGDEHARHAALHGESGVLAREDALQHERQPALGGHPFEVVPRERGGRREVLRHRLRVRGPRAAHVRQRQVGRNLEAELQVALAPPEPRHVDREHEGGVAALPCLRQMVERALPVADDVELEPARRVACRRRDLGVRARRGGRDAEEGACGRGSARGRDLAVGVEQTLHREGRDEQRHRDGGSQHGGRGRHFGDVDEHARAEAPAPVRGRVRPQGDLVTGAALEVAPDLRVDLRRGERRVVGDVDGAAHAVTLSRAFAAISRSPSYASSAGASSSGSHRTSATSTRIRSSISPIRPRPARRR